MPGLIPRLYTLLLSMYCMTRTSLSRVSATRIRDGFDRPIYAECHIALRLLLNSSDICFVSLLRFVFSLLITRSKWRFLVAASCAKPHLKVHPLLFLQ